MEVIALAKNIFPVFGAEVVATFWLPKFYENFGFIIFFFIFGKKKNMKSKSWLCISLVLFLLSSCGVSGNKSLPVAPKSLFVAPESEACDGVGKMECLKIKWDKDAKDWHLFHQNIEGFAYEPGFDYELLVREEKVDSPPADASSVKYILVKVVSKTLNEKYR